MTKREQIEQKAEALLQPIVDSFGFELVDTEYVKEGGQYYLRGYIDKEGGITIGDCEMVSRAFNPVLDEANLIEGAYTMEISSPGLCRPLKKEKDYRRSIGKKLEIHTYRAVGGTKEIYGILKSYDADSIELQTDGEETLTLMRKDISSIRLAFE